MFEINNLTDEKIEELKYLDEVIKYTLKCENAIDAELDVIIVDNEYIHKINKEYRGVDRPTDVISFALEDDPDIKLDHRILGDIYISIDKAREQANEYGHSLKRELCFLTVHGVLHLLGYDHMKSKKDEEVMFGKQDKILNDLGIER